jgi:hypothetical protein
MKYYYVRSKEHPWRIWLTTNQEQEEYERFRDTKNNLPISVPPTTVDRIDIHSQEFGYTKSSTYQYNFIGCIIVISKGKIEQLITNL